VPGSQRIRERIGPGILPVCPITLQEFDAGKEDILYSRNGLRRLHAQLSRLQPLPISAEDQRREAAARADKMSIQGVQPKLSAVLRVKEGRFEIVDSGGRFILKPCPAEWNEVPENEALTMALAGTCGIEVPDFGLVAASDGSWTFWIRRFDRFGRKERVPIEDFAQLQDRTRDTKYQSSMERVVETIERFCSFPAVEKRKLARRVLFCFLTGNEDMHLKNYSLITTPKKVELSPAYDLLNTSIILRDPKDEMAMPIRGKKSNLTRRDLVDHFCGERCGLAPKVLEALLEELGTSVENWQEVIRRSFLSEEMREKYLDLLERRSEKLFQ